jgi:Asp-tRNA(Asn)/Glu-tRNA(Gln) amidotransferase A subunit family amidase
MTVIELPLDGWRDLCAHAVTVLRAEAVEVNREILADPARRSLLGTQVESRLSIATAITADQIAAARAARVTWAAMVADLFGRVELLALPSVTHFPAPLESADTRQWNTLTVAFNFAGLPALSQPLRGGWMPPSLQLVGRRGDEERLVATGAVVESAAGWTWNA